MNVIKVPLAVPIVVLFFLVISTESNHIRKCSPKIDLLKRRIRQSSNKVGSPALHNCALEKQISVDTPIPINFELTISPSWTNYTEIHQDPSITKKYNWSYKLVKVIEESGKTIEEPLSIYQFESKDKSALTFSPYSLAPGYYRVYPNVTLKNPEDKLNPSTMKVCHMVVVGLKPIPLITGGTYRLVPSDTPIVFNGSDSLDPNTPSRDNSNLKYHWSCSQKLNQTFCKKDPISTRSVFIVPQRYVVSGDKFEVILKIATAYNSKAESRQTVEMVKDGVLLEIRCQKNCPPAAEFSNINIVTFLQVLCLKNCKDVKNDGFLWSVNTISNNTTSELNLDYAKDTQFGNKQDKFIIERNVLKPGDYQVTVRLNDKQRRGQAMTTLIFDQPPKVDSCQLLPPTGESLQMYFHFQCRQQLSFRRHHYELYAMAQNESISEGQLITDGFYPGVFKQFFMLPSSESRTFTIRVTIDNGPFILVPIQAKVTSSLAQKPAKERVKALRRIYEESLSGKMSSTDPVQQKIALKTFQALVNEIVDVKDADAEDKKFVADLKYRVIDDLLKVPLVSLTQMVKVGDAVAKLLTYDDSKKSDPLLAKASTTFCKKLGKRYVDVVRKERFPLINGEVSSKMASSLSKCFSANTNPNFSLLEPFHINITTEAPILLEPVLFEDYPDYRDFSDQYYNSIENLQEATANIFEGNQAAAKAIALSTAVGEKPIIQKGINSEILITKDQAKILSKMLLESNGVILKPSQDLHDDHPIDIFVMTWTKNLLWWNVNGTRPASNIVNIEFWHSTCKERIDRFNKPAEIFFEMKKTKFESEIFQEVIRVPKDYLKLKHSELNRHIYVRRVALPRGRVLLVEFHNLSVVFHGVVTVFKFPTIEDFIPGKVIQAGTNFIAIQNSRNYDIWAYVGILPRKDNLREESEIKFAIGVFSTCCILWQPHKNQWTPACIPGEENNLTTIHCKCTNFSTYAGHIQNMKSVRLEVLHEEFQLDLKTNLVIFLTLASALLAYCLLLLFTFYKRKKKPMVYFLADNLGKHRYAYLVMVTTGRKGTTSNVTMQLRGTEDTTPAHVLNYPDPKRLLLQQKCREVFVATNEDHLGEILGMDLWVDCSGAKPSWYCEEIEVYDLQWKKSWYFQVKRLFSPIKGNVFVELAPSQRNNRRVVNVMKKVAVWNFLHTWCFWAGEKNLAYITRLTVVLSTVLMTLAVVLMMQGVPEMELRDILDSERFSFGWFEIQTIVVASLVAFSLHIALTWLLRLSTSDHEDQRTLPHSISKLCWRVLIVLVVTSITFLIIWGFWVPYNRSLVWLTVSCLAVAIDIIIYENVFIIIISLLYKYEQVEYIGDQFEEVLLAIHQQRRFLMGHFGRSLLRPLVEQYHTPLKKQQIHKQELEDKIRQKLASEFLDLVMFTVYIIILYMVVLLNQDRYTVLSKNAVLSMVEGKHNNTLSFSSVTTVDEMYEYISHTLIPVLQPTSWYRGLPISSPGMMIDFCNKYLGVARFRQQRIPTEVCSVPRNLEFLNLSMCRPEFAMSKAETKHFGHKWGNLTSTLFLDRLRSIWQYFGEKDTETLPFVGTFTYYSGGGYVAFLGRTLRNSYANFRTILTKAWIDENTRGFFIEFLAYNANYNMFSAVRLLFEQSTTGYVATKIEIYSARMIFVQNEIEKMSIIFFGLFVLWVLLLFLQRSFRIITNFRDVYKHFWFWIDVAIIILSILCIVTYFIRLKMVGKYLDTIETAKHNEFIGYFNLFYIEDSITVCAAFLILIATARLWKFLRFGQFFRIMERTLSSGAFAMLSISLAFFVVLIAYGLSGLLIFGNEFPELSSLLQIITALVLLSLRPDSFDLTKYTRSLLDYSYFASYLILIQVISFIYVIIIIMSYMNAQLDFSGEAPSYNLRSFVEEQVQSIPQILRRKYNRMSGGAEKSYLKPKSDEFRYANCLSTQKNTLTLMKYITKSQIRNTNRGNKNTDLMLEVCKLIAFKSEEDELEIFFKGHFVGERIRMIDEKRIMKIADVVELLFRGQDSRSVSKTLTRKDQEQKCKGMIRSNQEVLKRCELALMSIYCEVERVVLDYIL